MKFPKISIKSVFTRWIKRPKYRHSHRDWFFIVIFLVCAAIISVLLEIFFYYEIKRGDIFMAEKITDKTPLEINRQAIETVSKYYFNKEDVIKEIISNKNPAVDPSL